MLNIILGVITIIGTGITIWQAFVAKEESDKSKVLADEAKKHLDEIKLIQKAIGLSVIKSEVDELYKKIAGIAFSQRGVNEKKIKSEIIESISQISSSLSNQYTNIHQEIDELKKIIFDFSTERKSLFDIDENSSGGNGAKKLYDQTYIILKLMKDELEIIERK